MAPSKVAVFNWISSGDYEAMIRFRKESDIESRVEEAILNNAITDDCFYEMDK